MSFCAARFIISCVEYTFGAEIIYTSLRTVHPIPLPAIHPLCYPWNKKKLSYFDRCVKLLAVSQGLQCVESSKDSWGKTIFSGPLSWSSIGMIYYGMQESHYPLSDYNTCRRGLAFCIEFRVYSSLFVIVCVVL